MLARALPDRRLACRNGRLSVHRPDGGTEHRTLASPGELADAVATTFGISFSDRGALERTAIAKEILRA